MSRVSRRNLLKGAAISAAGLSFAGFLPFEVMAAKEPVKGKAGINSIQHTAIYVINMDESIKFYEDAFGFKLITKCDTWEGPSKPLTLAFMKLGDAYIELLKVGDVSKIKSGAEATMNHFCLRTSNSEETYNHLKGVKGITMETPIIDAEAPFDRKVDDKEVFRKYGPKGAKVKIFFARGINGERYEIMQDNICEL